VTALAELRTAAFFILGVVVVGVLGYRLLEGYSWLEAFYMVAITLSTVGYREIRPLSPTGQIFTMLLLVGGIGAFFYTAVALVEKVVQGEFQQFFGKRRMQKKIDALTGHYLVCGFGRIGEVICRELVSKPVPFVILEQLEDRVREAEANGYLALQGDATDEKTLRAAGVQRAYGLFASLASDAANVFVTLIAKELNTSLFVVARAENEQSERILLRSGADKVISPYVMGGHRMAQAALRPAVVDIIDLATHHQSLELQLEEVSIPPSSPCLGKSLRDSGLDKQAGIIIVAIRRISGKMVFNPSSEDRLEPGDRLIALAEAPQLKEIERMVQGEI
jgi:voltage-gated potassium channel